MAVIHLMLGTLFTAGSANFCTQCTELFSQLALATHESGCQSTYVSTISVELNATGHRLYVVFK
ncbi:conserved hypothetical protein [Stutzerimonas stutzeri A1501]|uniref:Uncharacterized protein n=1 Tax=Stutzerimonas stutzeri (strain A1501) TaxID=379731 RepID=A4VPW9_STUS1|nr:conserved hypothetical protein [Stutzerimonas stutzeri A1501]